jgi:hypothetical protein
LNNGSDKKFILFLKQAAASSKAIVLISNTRYKNVTVGNEFAFIDSTAQ